MPTPIAICLEDATASEDSRFLQCVAVRGGSPGLSLTNEGRATWCSDLQAACDLWVSADERLVLLRRTGAPSILVRRSGRSVEAPCEKPVILIDQDEICIGAKHLRVHVHGTTESPHPPTPFVASPLARIAALAAAAVALGAAPGCNRTNTSDTPVEVRDRPPKVVDPNPTPAPPPSASTTAPTLPDASADAPQDATPDATDVDAAKDAGAAKGGTPKATAKPPIEIRHHPPAPPKLDTDKF